MKNNVRFIMQASAVAAVYVALTLVSSMLGLSSGVIQVRFSEALSVLPIFMPAAVPGLFVGCLVANLLTGSILIDVVFGSVATLIGAVLTYKMRGNKWLAILSPILSNTLILPFVLKFAYGFSGSVLYFMATIFLGEVISCGVLGYALYKVILRRKIYFK